MWVLGFVILVRDVRECIPNFFYCEGSTKLNNSEFLDLMEQIDKHLASNKAFVGNPKRMADIENAARIASTLFEHVDISMSDDLLQIGSLALRLDFYDVIVRGENEINAFIELISKADNFEIGSLDNERTRLSIMFQNALVRL